MGPLARLVLSGPRLPGIGPSMARSLTASLLAGGSRDAVGSPGAASRRLQWCLIFRELSRADGRVGRGSAHLAPTAQPGPRRPPPSHGPNPRAGCNGRTTRPLCRGSQRRRGRRGSAVPAAGVAVGTDAPAASRHGTAPWAVNPHTGRLTASTARTALLIPGVGASRRRMPRCNTPRRLVPRPHALLRRETRITLRHLLSRSQDPLRALLAPQRSPGPVSTVCSPTPGADCLAQRGWPFFAARWARQRGVSSLT